MFMVLMVSAPRKFYPPFAPESSAWLPTSTNSFTKHSSRALAQEGIHLRPIQQLNETQIAWARELFQRDILPILTPLAVDPSHPFPQLLNKSVNLVILYWKPGHQETTRHAFVQIPVAFPA